MTAIHVRMKATKLLIPVLSYFIKVIRSITFFPIHDPRAIPKGQVKNNEAKV